MSRVLRAAAAQMGPTRKADGRARTLTRMARLLERAATAGARLVVFPELALTRFFPRWLLEGAVLDQHFERGMPNEAVQPLFNPHQTLLAKWQLSDDGIEKATINAGQ